LSADARLYEAVKPAEMFAGMARRIELIEQSANEMSKGDFARKWLTVMSACAAWFGALPLAPDLYREPGGAFRATVEIAFYAMRLASGQKFGSGLRSEIRRRLEPQYNYAVFLAAVCSKLDEPHRHFDVVRADDGVIWQPASDGPLAVWTSDSPFELRRRAVPLPIERMRTGMLAQMVIGPELLAGIEAEVQAELFGAINPTMQPISSESLMHKVLRQAVTVATDFDRRSQLAVFAPVSTDIPTATDMANAGVHTPVGGPAAPPVPQADAVSPVPGTNDGATHVASKSAHVPVSGEVPAAVSPASPQSRLPFPGAQSPAASVNQQAFDEVLQGASGLIKDFFRALREDVAAGTAKVAWNDKGLVLSKRLIGGYGVASDTLVEQLRKRNLVLGNTATDVTLAPRAGALILEAPAP